MKVRRKPIYYAAVQQADSNWLVTNLLTKECKSLNDAEFQAQFEPVRERKQPVAEEEPPKPEKPTAVATSSEIAANRARAAETDRETAGMTHEERDRILAKVRREAPWRERAYSTWERDEQ